MISIAVCDDNEITAQEISEKVKQCCPIEAEVSVFYHIKDILFSIHNENKLFDIIFMDIEFDVSSGIEASKQINAWHPDCQIIYISYRRYNLSDTRKDGFSFRTFMSLVLSISPKLYRKWTAHR